MTEATIIGSSAVYLRNSWYVVAWSRDLAEKPLSITVMDEPLVVFRDPDGRPAVLADRCPHRHLPLSMGCAARGGIQCGYHGMVFDRDGKCLEVPSQSAIPPRAQVRAYPAEERHGWIWAWMGETAAADPGLIPDFSEITAPGQRAVGRTNHVKADYKLVTDNLMDLSHVGYVHQSTIGNPEFTAKGKLTSRRSESRVHVLRLVDDVPPPPTYVLTGVLPEGKNIDRWQRIEFVAPAFVRIHVGGKEAGTGALDGDYGGGLGWWVMNAMTPESNGTTHYFWAAVRDYALDDPAVDELYLNQVSAAFAEDKVVLEAQQRVLDTRPDTWDLALKSDAGSIEARRVLDAAITAEQAETAVAA
jgi:phenylpropionate dioxygenase-like ring-hydroxylating dioxygenase large terminal subunit